MTGDRPLFTIMVTHRSEGDFYDRYEAQRERAAAEMSANPNEDDWFSFPYAREHPAAFPFNDLYGFFEVLWDGGTRILTESYFRGDARRKAGQRLKRIHGASLKASGFHLYQHRHDLAWLRPGATRADIQASVEMALREVRRLADELGGIAHMAEAHAILPHVDWDRVLRAQIP